MSKQGNVFSVKCIQTRDSRSREAESAASRCNLRADGLEQNPMVSVSLTCMLNDMSSVNTQDSLRNTRVLWEYLYLHKSSIFGQKTL